MGKYIPEEGHRIRGKLWSSRSWVDVKFVGEGKLFAVTHRGHEGIWDLGDEWFKVETPAPLPELWIRQYESGTVATYTIEPQHPSGATATTHLIPEGDGYRAEVVRKSVH